MIYIFLDDFTQAVADFMDIRIPDPDSHKKTAVFTVGDATRGHHLFVDASGWVHNYNMINVERSTHIASPLANLQAAAMSLGLRGKYHE